MLSLEELERNGIFSGKIDLKWLHRGVLLSQAWRSLGEEAASKAKEYLSMYFLSETIYQDFQDNPLLVKRYLRRHTYGGFALYQQELEENPSNCLPEISEDEILQPHLQTIEPLARQEHDFFDSSLDYYLWDPLSARYSKFSEPLDPTQKSHWNDYGQQRVKAEERVKELLIQGTLRAFGSKGQTAAVQEWIPRLAWRHLNRDRIDQEKVGGEGSVFYHVQIIDVLAWREMEEERRTSISIDEHFRTGKAGRPTSVPLILAEFDRRFTEGQSYKTLAGEARYILSWLSENHPNAPPISLGGMKNALRHSFNEKNIK